MQHWQAPRKGAEMSREPQRDPTRAREIPAVCEAGLIFDRKPALRTFGRAVDEPAANCG